MGPWEMLQNASESLSVQVVRTGTKSAFSVYIFFILFHFLEIEFSYIAQSGLNVVIPLPWFLE